MLCQFRTAERQASAAVRLKATGTIEERARSGLETVDEADRPARCQAK